MDNAATAAPTTLNVDLATSAAVATATTTRRLSAARTSSAGLTNAVLRVLASSLAALAATALRVSRATMALESARCARRPTFARTTATARAEWHVKAEFVARKRDPPNEVSPAPRWADFVFAVALCRRSVLLDFGLYDPGSARSQEMRSRSADVLSCRTLGSTIPARLVLSRRRGRSAGVTEYPRFSESSLWAEPQRFGLWVTSGKVGRCV